MSLDTGEASADHIETYPVIWGTRGGTGCQPDPKLASNVDPEAVPNITDPGAHGQKGAEDVADSHDRYANQEVSYALRPEDDTATDEACEGHMEVLSGGS
jgi:hypothetical protein